MPNSKENKSLKKKNYFTGHRIIGDKKSEKYNYNRSENSETNTSDYMKQILDTDTKVQNDSGSNRFASLLGSHQMNASNPMMSMNNQMMPGNPMMSMNNQMMPGNPMMAMSNQMVPGPIIPGNSMMSMMNDPMSMSNQMASEQMMSNNPMMSMMGKQQSQLNNFNNVDPLLVDSFAPLNNRNMNGLNNLMEPSQMAQSFGSLANLSKLSNIQSIGNNMHQTELNNNSIKNLAALNQIKMI
jgi:hypothetical protein